MSSKAIQITEFDLDRLQKLIVEASHSDIRGRDYLARLQTGQVNGAETRYAQLWAIAQDPNAVLPGDPSRAE